MKNKIKENYNHLKKNVFLVNKNIKKFIEENYKYSLIFSIIYHMCI